MMKRAGFLLALMCILSLTGCGMVASAEEEMLQPNMEENVVSVNNKAPALNKINTLRPYL